MEFFWRFHSKIENRIHENLMFNLISKSNMESKCQKKFHGIFWKFHGTFWKFHGILWKFHGIFENSMEFFGNSMELLENSMEFLEIPWNF